ncbi:MAG: alanine racemase, partial [Acidocella sp.]|nr:alanine racemase [Acidocella sp.]
MTALLEIDLGAIAANWHQLAATHPGETAAVLKADAYGLGAARVAPVLAKAGCRAFFTAHLDEAVALRQLLPEARIAALNGLFPHAAADFYEHNITPVLSSLRDIALWHAEAAGLGRPLPCMLHLEMGMNRLGLTARELETLRANPSLLGGVQVDVVLTHLVAADTPDDPVNRSQAMAFYEAARQFPGAKKSLANSSGMFLGPFFHTNLARPGAALYGVNPTPAHPNPMRGVVRLTAPILQIHDVAPGETVGYSGVWRAERPSRIATLGVGYADGYHRALTNAAHAYFDDTPIPLVGRVSMDLTTFDVTDVPATPGDMLTLLGPRHGVDAL